MPRVYTRGPLDIRFNSHVDRHGRVPTHKPELGPCHVWTGGKNEHGYGLFNVGDLPGVSRKCQKSHRVAFLIEHGRWPENALHRCDNPACVKTRPDELGPAHVIEGTQGENVRDMVAKGRHGMRDPSHAARGSAHGSRLHPERILRGERSPAALMTVEQVREIRALHTSGETLAAIGRRYGVTYQCISHIVKRRNWSHVD